MNGMTEQLIRTIELIKKVDKFLNPRGTELDESDVIDTFKSSQERLAKFLDELKRVNLQDKKNVNKLLVHIELEYANLVWSLEEMRDFINRSLVKYPD